MEDGHFNLAFEESVPQGGGTSDFNALINRPKYNGALMTGNTNIPAVPTKTSDLTNDSDFVDQQALDTLGHELQGEIAEKQDRLTAGENITIENNVISAASTYVTIVVTPSMVISDNPLTLQFTAAEDAIITNPSNMLIKIDATQIGVGASIFTKSNSNRTGEYVLVNNVATYTQGALTVDNSTANVVVYRHSDMVGVYSVKNLQDKLTAGDNIIIEGDVISATTEKTNAYESIEEVGDADDTFLFNTSYSELDYGAAKEYFDSNANPVAFACSVIVKDGELGRNYDWLYSNQAEFRVETPHTGHRYATSGIAAIQGLDKDFVKSGAYSELYKYMPFSMLDGQNEKGLQAAILVVPDDKGDTTGTPTSGGPEQTIRLNALMLIRYALDHFATVQEVRVATQRYLSIYVPQKLRDLGYECHFLFKDDKEVYALEFDSNACVWTDITKKPIMTNFFLTGVDFKEDGTIYKVGEEGVSTSGLTAKSQGLERYNILLAGLNDLTMSVEDIMDSVKYTQLYKNEFQNAWVSEYAGTNGLTVFDEQVQFYNTYLEGQRAFADRSRENPVTDQTVHTAIYGDYLNIFTQERSEKFVFPIVREVYPDVYRIECADYLTIEGHTIPDVTLEQMNKAIADGVIADNRTLCVSNLVAGEFYTVNMSVTEGTDFTISFLYEDVGIFQYTNELKTEVTAKFISFDKPNIVGYYDEDNDKFYTTSALTEEIEPKGDTLFVDITYANAPRLFLCLMSGYSYSYKEFDGGGTGGATWGSITGTLSNQTDLQAALDDIGGKIPELLGSTGQSTTAGMTQKAITDALASAGGVKVLTADDYNYPTDDPDGVALWLLDSGLYQTTAGIKAYFNNVDSAQTGSFLYVVGLSNDDAVARICEYPSGISHATTIATAAKFTNNFKVIWDFNVIDNLVSTTTDKPLSANQGKALKDLIDSLIIKGSGAPTTATVGTVGQLYEDTANGDLYQCTAVSGGTYTWEAVGGGGGVNVVQTTGTSTTDVMSQDATTKMIYPAPSTSAKVAFGFNSSVQSSSSGTAISGIVTQNGSIAISGGWNPADVESVASVGIGAGATIVYGAQGSVALGAFSSATQVGQFDIGSTSTSYGYNSTNYRLLTGVHDPVSDHDAATKKYVDDHSGGGGVNVVQTTGTSTTDVMSQKAVTDMVYSPVDAHGKTIKLGTTSGTPLDYGSQVSIGENSSTYNYYSIAIGYSTRATANNSVAIGRGAQATQVGQFDISTGDSQIDGYNNSGYRLLTGLYDGQSAHDAATYGQIQALQNTIDALEARIAALEGNA